MTHRAGAHELSALLRSRAGKIMVGAVGVIAATTVVGLALLWSPRPDRLATASASPNQSTRVIAVRDDLCPGAGRSAESDGQQCRTLIISPTGTKRSTILLGPTAGSPELHAGDAVVVAKTSRPQGTPDNITIEPYAYVGIDRSTELGWAAFVLCAFALLALRIRGILAIAGVGLSLLLLTNFLVPAILAGHSPELVAIVGALAVMFVTVTLTNGIGAQAMAGVLGISLALLAAAGLSVVAVHALALDGSGSELSTLLAQARPGLSLQGVLLAGMVIGALGVLADTAVTQASAVMSLRHTDTQLQARALYVRAVGIGRDHLAATIHTLVLAYAGTALPLLLVLDSAGASSFDVINHVDIVEPIIASLVGCAALIAAVPLTTALSALLIARIPATSLPAGHGHAH